MIKTLDKSKYAQWDSYVQATPEATFFHQSGWKEVIERAFGHKTYFLYVENNGEITGILPLVHIKSLLFGNTLVSTGFCVYGGIVANDGQTALALDKEACRLAEELGVDCLEMRNRVQKTPERPYKELYVTFRKELDADVESSMRALPKRRRAMIRKGIEAGLTSTIDDGVDRLYQAYSEGVRNLGTPVFPKKYFQILKDVFADQCEVLSIELNGQLVASIMNFYYKDEVLPYYTGRTSLAHDVNGNDFMCWEVMRRAIEKGVKIFDYGRSKIGTGSYSFKKNWGFTPQPLFYEFHLVKAGSLPNVNPLNPKYRLFIAAWKLLPLPVSQLIGPWLSKDLG